MDWAWQELVGYAASLLVAASLMLKSVARLRWVNLVGALCFASYGALVHAWPVLAVNLLIAGIDTWFLVQMYTRRDFFTLLPIHGCDAFGRKFLRFHERDIRRFFPDFDPEQMQDRPGFFVLRNMFPAGVFYYSSAEGGDVAVRLDYVVPEYRDGRNAEFLFRILNEQFSSRGARRFTVRTGVPAHVKYLLTHGFERTPAEKDLFQRAII
ncbi:MAG TPA: hypothetical protein VGK67_29970 [Myxococcales bacterium]|jgi:hypothetical protein